MHEFKCRKVNSLKGGIFNLKAPIDQAIESYAQLSELFDDLVANQASTWGFNKYVAGSISGLTVQQSDPQGRPAVVKANYNYMGFGSSPTGWVQINFSAGLPKCMYFFDFPQNCKTPNSSIVASYAQGAYGK